MLLEEAAKKYGIDFSPEKIRMAIDDAVKITKRNIIKFQDSIPSSGTYKGIYRYATSKRHWEGGFWGGIIWLCYEATNDFKIKCYGEKIVNMISSNIIKEGLGHNDLGFYTIPSCIPMYKMQKSKLVRETMIEAANSQLSRYDKNNHILMSHDFERDGDVFTLKISVLLNALLFNYAYIFTGNTKYKEAFLENVDFVIKNNITDKGEAFFFSLFDSKTGQQEYDRVPEYAQTERDSEKIRNYAWSMCALAIFYSMSKDEKYADIFHKLYTYMKNLGTGNDVFYYRTVNVYDIPDTSSAAIIACALIEMIKNDNIRYTEQYAADAAEILNTLIDKHRAKPGSNWEGLLHNAYFYKNYEDDDTDYSSLCGDYFYMEALIGSVYEHNSCWYSQDIF